MQQRKTIQNLGATASFGVAAAYLGAAVVTLFMPPELQGRTDVSPHEFWMALSREPTAHLCFHWAWIVAGLCGLAAVPAISRMVYGLNQAAVLWSGLAALLGFATHARSHLMEQAWDRKIIPLYANADPAFQQAVHVVAGLALDIGDGVLTFGAIGIWVLIVSQLVLRSNYLPRFFGYLGFAAALSLVAGMAGYGLSVRPLIVFSIGAGAGLLVPVWFVWAGILLRRNTTKHPHFTRTF
jgi:hypothetical protein